MSEQDIACRNTDKELWRESTTSIHVTEQGGIGINVSGHVIVKPLREWHALAAPPPAVTQRGRATDNRPIIEGLNLAREAMARMALEKIVGEALDAQAKDLELLGREAGVGRRLVIVVDQPGVPKLPLYQQMLDARKAVDASPARKWVQA